MTTVNWKVRQGRLNTFVRSYIKGVAALRTDGTPGPATHRRIRECQWWLGWNHRDGEWSDKFDRALIHPGLRGQNPLTVARGIRRRRDHNRAWLHHQRPTSGVTMYDGVPVAAVAVPILTWCRNHGWHGRLVSGYRDPVYSEKLCFAMCGRPACPGRCAGRASNHVGTTAMRFAVDVSDYWTFRQVVAKCPLKPHIFNALPSDPVHFSPSGN